MLPDREWTSFSTGLSPAQARAHTAMAARLGRMRGEGSLPPFALAMKRVANIIPKPKRAEYTRELGIRALEGLAGRRETDLEFSSSLFSVEAEGRLYEEVSLACARLGEARRSGEAERSIDILTSLVPAINAYFEGVLVNCEDENARNNRIAFLLSSYRAFTLFCDFSAIAGE